MTNIPIKVTPHLAEVFAFVESADGWVTANEIILAAKVASVTARVHALNLTRLGIFEREEIYPEFLYRMAPEKAPLSLTRKQRKFRS